MRSQNADPHFANVVIYVMETDDDGLQFVRFILRDSTDHAAKVIEIRREEYSGQYGGLDFIFQLRLVTTASKCVFVLWCTTSAFEDEPGLMLKIIQRFGRHCSCHLQGE
jgi:hypothetical protein